MRSTVTTLSELRNRIIGYLANGGMFNPELIDHKLVRNLLIDCRNALDLEKLLAEARLEEHKHDCLSIRCRQQEDWDCPRAKILRHWAELRALAGSSAPPSRT
jgi:hypothetical protein